MLGQPWTPGTLVLPTEEQKPLTLMQATGVQSSWLAKTLLEVQKWVDLGSVLLHVAPRREQ